MHIRENISNVTEYFSCPVLGVLRQLLVCRQLSTRGSAYYATRTTPRVTCIS